MAKKKLKFPEMIVGAILAVGVWFYQSYYQSPSLKVEKLTGRCEDNLYQGQEPTISKTRFSNSQQLCYIGYAARADYLAKSNIYSAERLTADRVSVKLERENSFHEEQALPPFKRAELADYRTSGYDRGHLAPSADMPTKQAQHESFSLSNMVPQVSEHNQKTWAKVESKVRALAKKYQDIYVVTLPTYYERNGDARLKMKTIGANKVVVPLYIAKAVYIPSINKATVILSPNDKSNTVETISLNEYKRIGRIDVFPTLSESVKNTDGGFFKW